MEFDLFTFAAQVINFIILVALLNKFLFGAIKKTMDEREAKINSEIEAAEENRREAAELVESNAALRRAFEEERKQMISLAAAEAELKKEELLKAAKEEAQKAKDAWQRELAHEEENFLKGLEARSVQYVCALADRMLKDLGDEKLEERIAQVFIRKLMELEEKGKADFAGFIKADKKPLAISSSFELSEATKIKIADAVKYKLDYQGEIVFEIQKELYGIELKTRDYTLAWNVNSYLAEFEEKLAGVFEGRENTADAGKTEEKER